MKTTLFTTKSRGTDMMKMFSVVRVFLERYYKSIKTSHFYCPEFADNLLSLWYGLSETERSQVLTLARRDDMVGLEELLRKIDKADQLKEAVENAEENEK